MDGSLWWAPFVERFAELGVTQGYRDGTFRPFSAVSRAQMAAFLTRAFDLGEAGDAGFGDTAGNTHYEAINALAASGVTQGYSDGTFRPDRSTTRAQMAAFIHRAVNLVGLPPSQRFAAVDAGSEHTCGLRTDNTIVCWGNNGWGQTEAPDGQYQAVAAGWRHSCGLRTDDTIVCWGDNDSGQANAPDGRYDAVTAGTWHSCGLGTDNTVVCWGSNDSGQANAPDGRYSAVTAGQTHSCGLRTDNTVICWGDNGWGQTNAPNGRYSAVTIGTGHSDPGAWHSCGLGTGVAPVLWTVFGFRV